MITTCQQNILHMFGHTVVPSCNMFLTIFTLELTTPNMLQYDAIGLPNAPNNVAICYVDMLCSFGQGLSHKNRHNIKKIQETN